MDVHLGALGFHSTAHVIRNGFEEWTLVTQISDMAASSDFCALQANLTLVLQLKGSPSEPPQPHRLLRLARLWAILLHNCGKDFAIYNCSAPVEFLSNLENILAAEDANPGVTERFLRVLAYAVAQHAYGDLNHPYARLWIKYKHPGEPSLVS